MKMGTQSTVMKMIPRFVLLGMALALAIGVFPGLALGDRHLPASSVYTGGEEGYVGGPSPIPCVGGETVLLIQDVIPWFAPANQDPLGANVTELEAQGKNFCMIFSQDIGVTNLAQFPEILISAAQTQAFYNNLFPAGVVHPAITAYVQNGGILSANLTDFASGPGAGGNWVSRTFVGGVQHVLSFSENNNIADPTHPIIANALPCPSGNCAPIVDAGAFNDLDNWNLSSHGYFINLPPSTTVILSQPDVTGDSVPEPVMVEYPFGAGVVIATLTTTEWRYAGNFGGLPQNRKLLANEIAYQDSLVVIEVPVDIKPQSCPNPLNCRERGVLPAAILGTADFDVTQVDPASVQLEGVPPLRWALEDVATPFEPFTGKEDCFNDCTTEGRDGFLDLTLKFDAQAVLNAIGPVEDQACLVLKLTGTLKPEFGGTPIQGEDVVRILCR